MQELSFEHWKPKPSGDLIILAIKEFDTILGMDCLTKYHTNLDCMNKIIQFSIPESSSFDIQYNPMNNDFLTSRITANKSTSTEIVIA